MLSYYQCFGLATPATQTLPSNVHRLFVSNASTSRMEHLRKGFEGQGLSGGPYPQILEVINK